MLKASPLFKLAAYTSLALCYLVQGTYARNLVLDLDGEGSCTASIRTHAGQNGRMTFDEFKMLVTYLGGDSSGQQYEDIFSEFTGTTCTHFFENEVGTCDSETIPYFAGARSLNENIYLFKVCESIKLEIIALPTATPPAQPIGQPSPSTPSPTDSPSAIPTISPSASPTTSPSTRPSLRPTQSPTSSPTSLPSVSPTIESTVSASPTVTTQPSISPTVSTQPSISPSVSTRPSHTPTNSPTVSQMPSSKPSAVPTDNPTVSALPSLSPTVSSLPSSIPSVAPTPEVPTLGWGAIAAISVGSIVAGSSLIYYVLGGMFVAACRGNRNNTDDPVEVDFPISVPSESEAILSDDDMNNSFRNSSQISQQSNVSMGGSDTDTGPDPLLKE